MKAVRFHAHGGPEVLRYEEAPDPVPGRGEALIRVSACALNHLDIWIQQGGPAYRVTLPHISGSDVSGMVESFGSDAPVGAGLPTRPPWLKPGAPVVVAPGLTCGRCEFCLAGEDSVCERFRIVGAAGDGGYAEKVVVPIRNLFPKPEHLTFEQAAAFPLTFLTAWHMLITRAGLRPGQTVLVLAAGSGVGVAAVQIARLAGARVIAAAGSDEKCARARDLGAQDTINYEKEDLTRHARALTDGRGVDVVFEHVGPATFKKSVESLASNGTLVTCGATTGPTAELDLRYVFSRQLRIIGSRMGTLREFMTLTDLIARKRLVPVVDSTYPLSEARAAQEKMHSRQAFGKIVLTMNAQTAP